MKKLFAAILVLLMVLPGVTSAAAFVDIESSYAKDAILSLQEKGVVNGVDSIHFAPKNKLTRAQFAKMIVLALELEQGGANAFSDVKGWAVPFVNAAAGYGLVNGIGGGKFSPEAPVTREMAATIIYRAFLLNYTPSPGANPLAFSDRNSISEWALEAVAYGVDFELIHGSPDGTFKPQQTMTREMAAQMIVNLLNVLERLSNPAPVVVPTPTPTPPPTPVVVVNPGDYLQAQDFGYWADQNAYNVGFKINIESLPYSNIQSISVSLKDADGNTLATRTATGSQIAKLAADDETYGGTDGQLSAAFIARTEAASNEWWSSTAYDLTAPTSAVITIITNDNKIIRV